MKKVLTFILAFWFSTLLICFPAAASSENSQDSADEMQSVLDSVDSELQGSIDGDTAKDLDDNGVYADSPESISDFSVSDLIGYIFGKFTGLTGSIFKLIAKVTAAALLCAFVRSVAPENGAISSTFSTVTVICALTVMIDQVTECVGLAVDSLQGINTFMLSYIPVYSSIIATSGSPAGGTAYYVTLFTMCELMTLIANKIFMPLMSIVMAISVIEAINPNFSFCHIAGSLKNLVKWLMGVMMTIFVGSLSVQSIIGVSADTVGIKAAKYAVSTFVPVVGGAVSDAYSTVRSSLGIIRSGIGGFGIIVILFIALRPILLSAALKLVTSVCCVISEIMGEKELAHLMNSTSSVLSMCLSIVICTSLVFIISTALLMLASLNLT